MEGQTTIQQVDNQVNPNEVSASSDYVNLIFFALFFLVIYFFSIRPQRKKQKEQQQYLANLKKGDKVMTIGGLYGTIDEVTASTITLVVNDHGTKLKFIKNAISYEGMQQTNNEEKK